MFLLFGFKLQYYLRRWKQFSYFLLFPKKWIYSFLCVFLHLILDVSLSCVYKRYPRNIRLKQWLLHSPLTCTYRCRSPFPANFYEQLHLKGPMLTLLAKCCFSFPFFWYIFVPE